jgi:hypothetical protein
MLARTPALHFLESWYADAAAIAQITILYDYNYDIRHVRMNEPHPARLTPSWYGDSVGHYEGDTLVIDTVGIRTDRPFAMVDWFGTPYTAACTW